MSMRTEPIWLMQIIGILVALAANCGLALTADQLLAVVGVIQALVVFFARRRTTSEATLATMRKS
jgi:hypothetical protein